MKTPLIHFSIILVLTLFAVGGYIFWYEQVQQMSHEAATLESTIAAKDADRSNAATARSGEAELQTQEAFIASHFVNTADIVTFLEQLERTGKEFGASVRVASVSDNTKSSDGRISLALSISGSFDAVMRTLGVIENGAHAIKVNDLTLDSSDQGKSWNANGIFMIATQTATTTP